MSIYSQAESGTQVHRSRFKRRDRRFGDIGFGLAYPFYTKFVLPGDIWKLSTDTLIRYQPMLAPSFTGASMRLRLFFVPIRLVEPNAELIITGSKDGVYNPDTVIPKFGGLFESVPTNGTGFTVKKGGLCDVLFQMPTGFSYETIKDEESMPAAYYAKAYYRCIWDYYRDENLETTYDNFEDYVTDKMKTIGQNDPESVNLKKDYLMSSLPWQLKGIAPRINSGVQLSFSGDWFSNSVPGTGEVTADMAWTISKDSPVNLAAATDAQKATANENVLNFLNNNSLTSLGFDAAEFRAMMAETRIFERLARTGSRYTEYLRANFGTSPSDGTLQRAQFQGGIRIPIVTTEVVQTAEDGPNPVGTLRGHGITHSGDNFPTFKAKEFGVLMIIGDVMPQIQYTQGIDREYTYKSRFDFFNPSFQHLSEQEVRNGEIYIGTDGKNDDTFGFQAYANELRSSSQKAFGEMRGTLAYWNQAITFASRPALNDQLIKASNYTSSFMKPFAVTDENPMVIDLGVFGQVWRPMVRYGTPGLVDHL